MENKKNIDLTLFVPCYNEEKNILGTLNTIISAMNEISLTYEIIIIDDASTDHSVEVIQRFQKMNQNIPIVLKVNEINAGLAYNFAEGSFLGSGKFYRQVNGDNDEPKGTLVKVFQNIGKSEMIITYHELNINRSYLRKCISKTFTNIINIITGHSIRYYNGLTVYYRVHVMRWHSRFQGFGYQADLTSRLLDLKTSYIEIPVVVSERQAGDSKAFTLNNFLSVGHVCLELFIRRIKKILFKQISGQVNTSDINIISHKRA